MLEEYYLCERVEISSACATDRRPSSTASSRTLAQLIHLAPSSVAIRWSLRSSSAISHPREAPAQAPRPRQTVLAMPLSHGASMGTDSTIPLERAHLLADQRALIQRARRGDA